jgi:hypothetical protein
MQISGVTIKWIQLLENLPAFSVGNYKTQ